MRKILLATFSVLLLAGACGQPPKPAGLKALVQAKSGVVTAAGKQVAAGDIIAEGTYIQVGPASSCDLMVQGEGSQIIVRLRENSEYGLTTQKVAETLQIKAHLSRGNAFFNPRLGANQKFDLATTTAIASVRGTSFSVVVNKDDSTATITVYEGRVKYRIRLADLDDLPEELIVKSKALNGAVKQADESALDLKAGEVVAVEVKDVKQLLEKVPELKEALEDPAVQKLKNKKNPTPEELNAAARGIDARLQDPAKRKRIEEELSKGASQTNQKSKTAPAEELKQQLEQYKAGAPGAGIVPDAKTEPKASQKVKITFRSRVKEYEVLLKTKGKGNVSVKSIETILGRSQETIKLKNGNQITGVIHQVGDKLHIFTPNGRVIIDGKDLAEVRF